MSLSPRTSEVRRAVCRQSCTEHCAAYVAGTLDYSDPRAACPRRGWVLAWGCYGPCNGPTPAPPPSAPVVLPMREPTVIDLASRAAYAVWRAAAAKVHGERILVTEEEYAVRDDACAPCSYWDGSARLGFGKCSAPNCGCTKLKRWLTTEECKHPDGPRWPRITRIQNHNHHANS